MALNFYPRAGQIFVGDFSDLKEPEMTKVRPVIVVSPRLPYRSEIVAVVPISLTAPKHNLPYCFRLSKNYHPQEPDDLPCWAKADMLMNVATKRLSAFKIGRRQYDYPTLIPEDLAGVRHAVLCGLGLDKLILKG
ncbi:MAG: type II toxin-antitoxin system PemK/MazF family toxin [Parvibaculum sp.]|uniref:type II toxin-antitoxin system PemK/MazF family toxin n=1 Tax=Parvibaculum sp. TaxID=2024848 RepID=UPI0032F08EEF